MASTATVTGAPLPKGSRGQATPRQSGRSPVRARAAHVARLRFRAFQPGHPPLPLEPKPSPPPPRSLCFFRVLPTSRFVKALSTQRLPARPAARLSLGQPRRASPKNLSHREPPTELRTTSLSPQPGRHRPPRAVLFRAPTAAFLRRRVRSPAEYPAPPIPSPLHMAPISWQPYFPVPASSRLRLPQLCRFCKAGHLRPRPLGSVRGSELACSRTEQLNSLARGRGPQLPVQRSQRDFPAKSNLQVSSVINREPVALGQM